MELERELEVAERLGIAAGLLALRYREGDLRVELKEDDEPVTIADRQSSELIVAGLREGFPNDVIISEENPDDLRRLEAERVWYIDPIDGTKDYIQGWEGFCVMIGLTVGHRPVLGVLFQPVGKRLYSATPDIGAWIKAPGEEPQRLRCSQTSDVTKIRLVASKSHRGGQIDDVKRALGIDIEHNIGSVGLKLGLIALGERDLYVNPFPKCRTWDTCAPEAVLSAAGGRMTDLHGDPLRYDQRDSYRRHGMVASNAILHDRVIELIAPIFPRN
jgi:3'(2'), 5'-bisphosphate nucleotidase